MTERKFKKGDVICKEGDLEEFMYDIVWGTLGLYANYGKAGQRCIARLQAGEEAAYFGVMGLLDSMPRTVTVVALSEVHLRIITPETFGKFFNEKPAKVLAIMQHMSSRLRGVTQDYLDACRLLTEIDDARSEGREISAWSKERAARLIGDFHAGTTKADKLGETYYRYW